MLPVMSTSPAAQDGREIGDGLGLFLQRIARTRLLTHAEELMALIEEFLSAEMGNRRSRSF